MRRLKADPHRQKRDLDDATRLFSIKGAHTAALIAFSVIASPKDAQAQVTWGGCIDALGRPVASVLDRTINDVAIARVEGQTPVIRYNPNVLASISDTSRLFWYLHECAHHVLGHTISRLRLGTEREADCWAAIKLKKLRRMSRRRLRNLQREMAYNPGDWTHLPGPMRVLDIVNCAARAGGGQALDPSPPRLRIPCRHRVPCAHRQPCTHITQQCGCQHPVDINPYNGMRMPCVHCGCRQVPQHSFDTVHPFDTQHPYDHE